MLTVKWTSAAGRLVDYSAPSVANTAMTNWLKGCRAKQLCWSCLLATTADALKASFAKSQYHLSLLTSSHRHLSVSKTPTTLAMVTQKTKTYNQCDLVSGTWPQLFNPAIFSYNKNMPVWPALLFSLSVCVKYYAFSQSSEWTGIPLRSVPRLRWKKSLQLPDKIPNGICAS